jgi:hypothetical protein
VTVQGARTAGAVAWAQHWSASGTVNGVTVTIPVAGFRATTPLRVTVHGLTVTATGAVTVTEQAPGGLPVATGTGTPTGG